MAKLQLGAHVIRWVSSAGGGRLVRVKLNYINKIQGDVLKQILVQNNYR